jgi:hypothetical protein
MAGMIDFKGTEFEESTATFNAKGLEVVWKKKGIVLNDVAGCQIDASLSFIDKNTGKPWDMKSDLNDKDLNSYSNLRVRFAAKSRSPGCNFDLTGVSKLDFEKDTTP